MAVSDADTLTSREMKVLQGLPRDQPYKQIGSDLEISLNAVPAYIQRIYKKLHVHSKTQGDMKLSSKQSF